MERRVVITGLGVVSPVGTGVEKFWNSLLEGQIGALLRLPGLTLLISR